MTQIRHTAAILRVVAPFVLLWAWAAPAAAEKLFVDPMFGVNVTYNVQYGSNVDGNSNSVLLMLDVYQPTGPGLPAESPSIVLMHGGGFYSGDKSDGHITKIANAFAERGYVAVSINYRKLDLLPPPPGESLPIFPERVPAWILTELASQGRTIEELVDTMAAAVEDQATAVNWLVANAASYNIDPDMMAVGGYSAGAISSLLLGVGAVDGVSAPVRAVLSVAGGVFGGEAAVDPSDPGIFMMHGTEDLAVPFAEVGFLQDALTTAGVPFDSWILPGEDHLGLTAIFVQDPTQVFEFMHSQLVPEPSSLELAICAAFASVAALGARRQLFIRWARGK